MREYDKIRILVEVNDDIYDELTSYGKDRVNILSAEDAGIPMEESHIKEFLNNK